MRILLIPPFCAHSVSPDLYANCIPAFHLSIPSLASLFGIRQHLSPESRPESFLSCYHSRNLSRFGISRAGALYNEKQELGICDLAFDGVPSLPELNMKSKEETQNQNLNVQSVEEKEVSGKEEKEKGQNTSEYTIERWNRLQRSQFSSQRNKNSELGAMVARKLVVGLQSLEEALAGLGADEPIASTMEHHCANYGLVSPKVGSWLVMNLCRNGKPQRAIELYNWLDARGLHFSGGAYNSLASACIRLNLHIELLGFFRRMKEHGVKPSLYIYTVVMKVLSQHQGWEDTHLVYVEMLVRKIKLDVIAYNTLLAAYGRARQWERALNLWDTMRQEGCKENMGTCCLLLSTFVRCQKLDLALDIYFCVISNGWKPTHSMYEGLVRSCAEEGRWVLAINFLYEFLDTGELLEKRVWDPLIHAVENARKLSQYRWN
ncbi:hypothetical protein O6H91_07G082400 [Diphasiastrum complanatum]|uniref:Uncharacterized protein n=1 Tax=Diphasiastrum complanatum TaxID=34168 RepID=A0ACC2D7B5_DIPCM|nr:hypothetical protein O6H91_07G082400 [Diphasiastrum complanatum]